MLYLKVAHEPQQVRKGNGRGALGRWGNVLGERRYKAEMPQRILVNQAHCVVNKHRRQQEALRKKKWRN